MVFRETFSQKDSDFFERVINYLHSTLSQIGINNKQLIRTELICEEAVSQMIENSEPDSPLTVRIKKSFGEVSVNLLMKGNEFDISTDSTITGLSVDGTYSVDAIRSIVLMAYGDNLRYSHRRNENRVRIIASKASQTLYITLSLMVLGVLFGLASTHWFPESSGWIYTYLLEPIQTVYMSALQMIVAPVVFFSIVTCFSQYSSIAEFGRLGARIMGFYLFTTLAAVLMSLGIFHIFTPGELGFALKETALQDVSGVTTEMEASILDTIIDIVPSNFLSPFLESNTLQLMFLAVICGVALGMIGDYAAPLANLFESLNSLFLTITKLVLMIMPLATFCAMSILIRDVNFAALGSLLHMALVHILSIGIMICIYGLLILVIGRLNPFTFYKNAKEAMVTSFILRSSSATLPTSLKVCNENLGIPPKVSNFSIPLGATVNMDGTSIFLVITGLFLARGYGVEIPSSMFFTLIVTIILLSLGAPGIPGSTIFCLGVVLNLLDIPIAAIGLILGINPILEMFDTLSNVTGDLSISLIVAKLEKVLDINKYKEKV